MNSELIFCPLGGSGEIGMNMNLYAYGPENNQKWIIVDVGVTFADESIEELTLFILIQVLLAKKKIMFLVLF